MDSNPQDVKHLCAQADLATVDLPGSRVLAKAAYGYAQQGADGYGAVRHLTGAGVSVNGPHAGPGT